MKMKKLLFIILLFASMSACGNKENLHIAGSVKDGFANGDTLYLVSINPDGTVQNLASCVVADGAFDMRATVDAPMLCNIVAYNKQGRVRRSIDLVADSSDVAVTVLRDYARVSGSALNDELQNYKDSTTLVKRLYQRYHDKKAQSTDLSKEAVDEADRVMETTAVRHRNIVYRAIERNIDNVVGLHIIKTNFNIIEPNEGLRFIDLLPAAHKNDYMIKYMQKYYVAVEKYAVGRPYADFVMQNSAGNDDYLSNHVGRSRPVILSFWISDSKRALNEQELLKEFERECADRIGFVGVSLDTDRSRWLSTIGQTHPVGVQLNDFMGWNSAALSIYGIDKCPYYILIDKNGTIVYRGLACGELLDAARALL